MVTEEKITWLVYQCLCSESLQRDVLSFFFSTGRLDRTTMQADNQACTVASGSHQFVPTFMLK